jgi:hypothetical protein
MEFMRDGGMGMWALVAAFVAIGVLALRAKAEDRGRVFDRGGAAILMLGILGMAMGMVAVSNHVATAENAGQLTAVGLGELANNGILAAILFGLLQVAAIFTAKRAAV